MGSVNGKPDKPLTPKMEAFCKALVGGANQSDAYREAYCSRQMATKTIHEKASRLIAQGKIRARVEELRSRGAEKVIISYARWFEEIQKCALFDHRKLYDANGNPVPWSKLPSDVVMTGAEVDEKGNIKLKLSNKISALELLGKAAGYYVEKVETPASALENTSTEILKAIIEKFRKPREERKVIDARYY